jgi:hypothetical protein
MPCHIEIKEDDRVKRGQMRKWAIHSANGENCWMQMPGGMRCPRRPNASAVLPALAVSNLRAHLQHSLAGYGP